MDLNQLRDEIYDSALKKGLWDEEQSFGDVISLCHAELSEAIEERKKGYGRLYFDCKQHRENRCTRDVICSDCECGMPNGWAVELADCLILILSYCGHKDINIKQIVEMKMRYNENRPYKHRGE